MPHPRFILTLASPDAQLDLLSGKLAIFGYLLAALIVLFAGWGAIFTYLRNRHKLRMRESLKPTPKRPTAWEEAGRRMMPDPPPPSDDFDDDDDPDDDGDDNDDDGDVPSPTRDPTLTPAAGV